MIKQGAKKIVLASKSPRRQELLAQITSNFEIRLQDVEEVYDPNMPVEEVPAYLAGLKAEALRATLAEGEVILAADTVVILDGEIIGKPDHEKMAREMLQCLSGRVHQVITGMCLLSEQKKTYLSVQTEVQFKTLKTEEIAYYVDNFKPLDKAGAYGIQEWIGMIGIERISGSYYNVMGLPLAQLWAELEKNKYL